MTTEERIASLERELASLKECAAIRANPISRWTDEKAKALGEELNWERPRIYNGVQTPFSQIIRRTLFGSDYRIHQIHRLKPEEERVAAAMWDDLADVVRRYAKQN